MLLKEFPDINWLKKAIAKDFADRRSWNNQRLPNKGWPTAILNVKTIHEERDDIKGPFSLFLNKSGTSQVRCDHKTVGLNTDTYVLTNSGQHYDLLINDKSETETFNIHFSEQMLKETLYSAMRKDEVLLDNPEATDRSFQLPIKTSFRDANFNQLVNQVESNFESTERESSLHALLAYLIGINGNHFKQISEFKNLRPGTKNELIRRIYISIDYIHAHYAQNLNLDELAKESMMSKFHFLRIFKSLFGVSPHQYIKQIRLQKAQALLQSTSLPLYLIAQQVGVENGSSLSRMIYQMTGRRPTEISVN